MSFMMSQQQTVGGDISRPPLVYRLPSNNNNSTLANALPSTSLYNNNLIVNQQQQQLAALGFMANQTFSPHNMLPGGMSPPSLAAMMGFYGNQMTSNVLQPQQQSMISNPFAAGYPNREPSLQFMWPVTNPYPFPNNPTAGSSSSLSSSEHNDQVVTPQVSKSSLSLPTIQPPSQKRPLEQTLLIKKPDTVKRTKQPPKEPIQDGNGTDDEAGSTPSSPSLKTRRTLVGLGGERRLIIRFTNYGKLRQPIQTCGRSGMKIPDGLCGTHTMYSQPWRFEVNYKHDPSMSEDAAKTTVPIEWTIVNLSSNNVVRVQETPFQAWERQTKGKTVCSILLKQALKVRLEELEEALKVAKDEGCKSTLQISNLCDLISRLQPKHCTERLLFFGLRHDCVQQYLSSLKSPADISE
jgi:hypothetical protein